MISWEAGKSQDNQELDDWDPWGMDLPFLETELFDGVKCLEKKLVLILAGWAVCE